MDKDKKLQLENDLKRTISKNLKVLMKNSNIKNYELADKIGVSESTVGKWLLMKSLPKMGTVEKLAMVFGVNKSDLLEDKASNQEEYKNNIESVQNEKDIAKTMEFLKSQLINEKGLMFDGELLDDETIQLVLEEIERQERLIKRINRKYTPKKYR